MGASERSQDEQQQGESRCLSIDEVLVLPGIARVEFYPDGQLRTLEFHAPAKVPKVPAGKHLEIVREPAIVGEAS